MKIKRWNDAPIKSDAPVGFKRQVCPHGSGFPCSQCLGAEARRVTSDPKTGALLMDGKVVRSSLIPDAELKMIREEMSRKMVRAHEGGRRETSCGICGKTGHTRRECSQRSKLISAEHTEKDEKEQRRGPAHCSNCGDVGHNRVTCPIPDNLAA